MPAKKISKAQKQRRNIQHRVRNLEKKVRQQRNVQYFEFSEHHRDHDVDKPYTRAMTWKCANVLENSAHYFCSSFHGHKSHGGFDDYILAHTDKATLLPQTLQYNIQWKHKLKSTHPHVNQNAHLRLMVFQCKSGHHAATTSAAGFIEQFIEYSKDHTSTAEAIADYQLNCVAPLAKGVWQQWHLLADKRWTFTQLQNTATGKFKYRPKYELSYDNNHQEISKTQWISRGAIAIIAVTSGLVIDASELEVNELIVNFRVKAPFICNHSFEGNAEGRYYDLVSYLRNNPRQINAFFDLLTGEPEVEQDEAKPTAHSRPVVIKPRPRSVGSRACLDTHKPEEPLN